MVIRCLGCRVTCEHKYSIGYCADCLRKMHSLDDLQVECDRLRVVNAKLLAALKRIDCFPVSNHDNAAYHLQVIACAAIDEVEREVVR